MFQPFANCRSDGIGRARSLAGPWGALYKDLKHKIQQENDAMQQFFLPIQRITEEFINKNNNLLRDVKAHFQYTKNLESKLMQLNETVKNQEEADVQFLHTYKQFLKEPYGKKHIMPHMKNIVLFKSILMRYLKDDKMEE